jgi:OPA family glycerol-3-phosphate transporter-like MFS transporter
MPLLVVAGLLTYIIVLYFKRNPLNHTPEFMWKRFLSWFPLGMSYAFMYMARYNIDVLGNTGVITKLQKSQISGSGFTVYAISLIVSGPLIDRIGGKKGMIAAALGAALANIGMGWAVYLHLHGQIEMNLTVTLTVLYLLNMFFQSFGAISTIKVKSFWFHVRERGTFGAIFGTLISIGGYFAFDWTQAIANAVKIEANPAPSKVRDLIQSLFALQGATVPAYWLIFLIPAGFLLIWALLDLLLVKDSPDEAGFGTFETHDASYGHSGKPAHWKETIRTVLSNRVLLMIGMIELASGVLREGVLKWYRYFADDTGMKVTAVYDNWGLWIAITGIIGSFLAGWVSDRFFHSRRAPVAGIALAVIFVATLVMMLTVHSSAMLFCIATLTISLAVIGVHSIMSGTATADFGGRKSAATATGVVDGFNKVGTAAQEFILGAVLTKMTWHFWAPFLMPFSIFGLFFAIKLWRELPEATKKYLAEVEKLKV